MAFDLSPAYGTIAPIVDFAPLDLTAYRIYSLPDPATVDRVPAP